MKVIKILPVVALMAALSGCVNDDVYETPDLSGLCTTVPVTAEVTDIFTSALPSYPNYEQYTEDDVIEAYVTSSDEGGTFYKSISFVSVDGTLGFSVPVDNYNLYNTYEPGRKVFVKLKDLYLSWNNGFQAGALYNDNTPDDPSDDSVGRLSGATYQDILIRSCEKVDEEELVNHVSIAQALSDEYLHKLIEIDNIQFADNSVGRTYFDKTLNNLGGATNHTITDDQRFTLIFRVSEFANFAGDIIPGASGKVRGVMTKFGSDYQFLVRTKSDIMLTEERFTPDPSLPPLGGSAIVYSGAFTEPFTSYTQTNQQNFPKYINDPVLGGRYWQRKLFGGNTYIQMTSFGGTPETNKTVFIIPVDMTAASNFSFKTLSGFDNGSPLKVYYSMDYVPGTNVNNATFVDITSNFNIPNGPSGSYASSFTSSGVYAIPASLTGNGYFIFEYNGDGNGGITTTIQIDDITVN